MMLRIYRDETGYEEERTRVLNDLADVVDRCGLDDDVRELLRLTFHVLLDRQETKVSRAVSGIRARLYT